MKSSLFYALVVCILCVGSLVAFSVSLVFIVDPANIFLILGLSIAILHIQMWLFLVETSIDQSISPIYRCAVFPALLTIPHVAGRLFSWALTEWGFGWDSFELSRISIAILAVLTLLGAVVTSVMIRGRDKEDLLSKKVSASVTSSNECTLADFKDQYGLTKKELEVATMYSQGRSVPVISKELYVSGSTVKTHIKNIYAKLGIHSKQELIDVIQEFT